MSSLHGANELENAHIVHFPVREGATVVNFDALAGVHAGDFGVRVGALSLHNLIERDGVTQSVDDPHVEQLIGKLIGAGVTFKTLGRQDIANGIAQGVNYSERDLDSVWRHVTGKSTVTTLEEHGLHALNQLDSQDVPPIIPNLYRSGDHKPVIAIGALFEAIRRGTVASVTVDADASRDTYVRLGVPEGMVHVIHNGIDTEKFQPSDERRYRIRRELEIGDNDPTILFVGRDSPEKDVPLFLRSAREYLENVPYGHVVMIGAGLALDNPNMVQMLRDNVGDDELMSRLHIPGPQPNFHEFYNAGDVLALTSATESRPLCISEAYASGIKVAVSTDVGDAKSMIGSNGIITNRNPSEIAEAWEEAYLRRDEAGFGFDITNRDQLGVAAMVAKYAKVIRAAAA